MAQSDAAEEFRPLFEPIEIGPVEIENRIYQPPHCTMFGENEQNAAFRATKAEGGFGLLVQEWTAIHPSTDYRPIRAGVIWDEETLSGHREITTAIHEAGSKAFLQIWHGGVQPSYFMNSPLSPIRDYPPLAPSDTQEPWYQSQAKEMEHEEIWELIDAFGDATERAKIVGYDGVEIHGGHGYLITQFCSPLYNKRDDEWGGDWEARNKFFLEVAKEVSNRVGDDMAVAARFTYNETYPGGLNAPEDDEPILMMEQVDDYIDFWDIDIGNYETLDAMITPASSRWDEHHQLEGDAALTPEVIDMLRDRGIETPVGGCGRVRDPTKAANVLQTSGIDMVGMVRQSISDPWWPKKVKEGRTGEIRECIACNTCVAGLTNTRRITCVQNPCAGEEYRGFIPERFEEADEQKTVLVAGGGPCGLEVARVAGERGHTVHLHEAKDELGGHTTHVVAKLPGRNEWNRLVEWKENELDTLENVEVHTGSELDLNEIEDYGADAVVFATGAVWDERGENPMTKGPLPGWELDHVVTPEDILVDGIDVGDRVLVADSDNHLVGPGIAEMLGNEGKDVTIMNFPGPLSGLTAQNHAAKLEIGVIVARLYKAGVETTGYEFPVEFVEDGALYWNWWGQSESGAIIGTGEDPKPFECDTVVLTTKRKSQRELYEQFKERANGTEAHLTGEAITPKTYFSIPKPLWWSHKLGRDL